MTSPYQPPKDSAESLLLEVLERKRGVVLERIREANGLTEREVLAVGEALRLIVEEARIYVSDSRAALEQLGGASMGEMLGRHGAAMSSFVQRISSHISAQEAVARQATEQTNRIVGLGSTIERVTMEAKILALNANIQSRRLGAAGESFQVIAQEMKRFSESVKGANTTVQELAQGLLEVLPRILALASETRVASKGLTDTFGAQLAEVADANQQMKEHVEKSLAEGEVRLKSILHRSQEALSHLQFQDPAAQGLLSCDRIVGEMCRHVEGFLKGDVEDADAEKDEGDSGEESMAEAGEVLLF